MAESKIERINKLKEAVIKAGTRFQAGKDRPAILKVQENFESLTPNEASILLPLLCENYKSLPPTNSSKLNEVMTKYTGKAAAAGYKDKAPTRKWETNNAEYNRFMGILMKDVDEKFRNWAVVMRALADYLLPIVEVYKTQGNTEVKSLGYKGFFIFFFERADTQKYLKAQKFITIALGTIAAKHLNTAAPKQGGLITIPKDFAGWLSLFSTFKKKLEAPSYEVWTKAVSKLFADPSNQGELSDTALANGLQAWLLVRPGRFLIDKTQILKSRKVIPIDWANEIAEAFGQMFAPFNGMFEGVPEVGEIESPEDLNRQLGTHYRIIRNAIAAMRAVIFGGDDIQLTAGMSRKLAMKLNLKTAFQKGLYSGTTVASVVSP